MNILIDLLPSEITIEGDRYSINTDFRIGILFEELMQSDEFTDEDKGYMALDLYYEEKPFNLEVAVKQMLWFYKCGKEDKESIGGDSVNQGAIYSFTHDDDYIYSAFLDQYGIDLQDIEDLHWWKFKAMFKSLKEDNKISKIMGYRSIAINNDMSDGDKKFYKEMKEIYSLPDLRTEEEKQADFDNALSNMF